MSVVVQELTKVYAQQRAVDAISFSARPGEILGFLGPNGAGKTTTMKILTGYVSASGGRALVGGHDVAEEPMAVRRKVGYLPEHNPLYPDMYVREYLRFVARLYKLSKPTERVESLIERTGLQREQHKRISALSKGYRQRVGLAQAMLHDPEVLILDEPTSGLDPNQLVDIRRLIKQLGEEKTVIFSTHIMQEVQALCDRVVIIDRGRLVADDPIETLQHRLQGEKIITVAFSQPVSDTELAAIPGVNRVRELAGQRWQLTVEDPEQDVRPAVFRFAVERDNPLLELHQEAATVEDVFQRLTAQAPD